MSVAALKAALHFSSDIFMPIDDPAIDYDKLLARRNAVGISSWAHLAKKAGVSRGSVCRLLTNEAGKYVREQVLNVLQSREEELCRVPTRHEVEEPIHRLTPPNDWKIVSNETPSLIAANGVSYQVAKLESELLPSRFARGKFYDLLHVPPAKLAELVERLTRHAKVCASLTSERRVAKHIDTRRLGEDTAWWVLDEWVDSSPLSQMIDSDVEFPLDEVKRIGSELLQGLSSLHAHKVLVRELAPERVLLRDDSSGCIITDFELAKLLDSDISVSGKWKLQSLYRAPEICGDDRDFRSDLFSWAVIATELLTGRTDADFEMIQKRTNDPGVAALIVKCSDKDYACRPASAEKVLQAWTKWKV